MFMSVAAYSDDLAIISKKNKDVKSMLHKIEKVEKDTGIQVNTDKTAFM